MRIKHSKLRNTGLLFELLVRQIASDTILGKNSQAIEIIKKYFINSEISKEYKLYQVIINSKILNEGKAEVLIETALSGYKKLNKNNLRNDKYNIIKEIKQNYDIDEFFKYKLNNYKELAAIYTLFESQSSRDFIDPSQLVENRYTLIEYVTKKQNNKDKEEDDFLEEYLQLDKGTRLVVYKNLIEKFNKKYSNLILEQKQILSEYINNIDNTVKLRECINEHNNKLKRKIAIYSKKVDDQTTQIKLNEVINLLQPIEKGQSIKDEHIISILQYYELLEELKNAKV